MSIAAQALTPDWRMGMTAANGQHRSVSCTSGESSVGHHGEEITLFSFPREIYAVSLLKCKMDGNSELFGVDLDLPRYSSLQNSF